MGRPVSSIIHHESAPKENREGAPPLSKLVGMSFPPEVTGPPVQPFYMLVGITTSFCHVTERRYSPSHRPGVLRLSCVLLYSRYKGCSSEA